MTVQIGDYDMEQVVLDINSDVNVLTNQMWELMGKPTLIWSPIQLRMDNQHKVIPIGRLLGIPVDLDGYDQLQYLR